ncbi:hypothetical protein DL98DRAFT_599913 [Cadophora sp. DSE1049]|nr:hypothetical protein DL98DRAFT_599913 [Cadophora sp. DSE1049]
MALIFKSLRLAATACVDLILPPSASSDSFKVSQSPNRCSILRTKAAPEVVKDDLVGDGDDEDLAFLDGVSPQAIRFHTNDSFMTAEGGAVPYAGFDVSNFSN